MMLRNDKRLPDLGLAVQPGYPRILAIYQLYDVIRFSKIRSLFLAISIFVYAYLELGCWMKKSFCSKSAHSKNAEL